MNPTSSSASPTLSRPSRTSTRPLYRPHRKPGDHSPEAFYELFRDWQRTQTQSSVTALRSLRQQMDVWFCRAQEPMPRGIYCVLNILDKMICTLSRACPGHPCLHLTDDLHGSRLIGQVASRSSLKTGFSATTAELAGNMTLRALR